MIACLFSCEHATCAIPEAYREHFRGHEDLLSSPEGWDPGALNLAQGFAMRFRTPLVHGELSRLLIDLNESGADRWSRISEKLPEASLAKLADRYEKPYRSTLAARIADGLLRHEAVVHLMIHTEAGNDSAVVLETSGATGIAADFAAAWQVRLQAEGIKTVIEKGGLNRGLAKDLLVGNSGDRYGLLRIRVPLSFFLEGKPLRWETLKKMVLNSMSQTVSTFTLEEKEEKAAGA